MLNGLLSGLPACNRVEGLLAKGLLPSNFPDGDENGEDFEHHDCNGDPEETD